MDHKGVRAGVSVEGRSSWVLGPSCSWGQERRCCAARLVLREGWGWQPRSWP